MERSEAARICNQEVLDKAMQLFGADSDRLQMFAGYEGCQNLVYEYQREKQPTILRISYRPERPVAQIQAELHFINYLAEKGARVSAPILSRNGNLLEVLPAAGIDFIAVSFVKGRGMRLPDNEYQYREGVSIDEYHHNWGQALGRMHALTKNYQPLSQSIRRPEWFESGRFISVDNPVLDRLPRVREKLQLLLGQLQALPRDREVYGLIHNDFNDGNFTVDYENGDITVFDFDDASYFWFMYDLACAWEGNLGWATFDDLERRKARVARYFDRFMEGYCLENSLGAEWLDRLPLFLKVLEMELFSHYVQYLDDPDEEMQAALNYRIRCIEEDIPYMGFFDPIFSPESPFCLGAV